MTGQHGGPRPGSGPPHQRPVKSQRIFAYMDPRVASLLKKWAGINHAPNQSALIESLVRNYLRSQSPETAAEIEKIEREEQAYLDLTSQQRRRRPSTPIDKKE